MIPVTGTNLRGGRAEVQPEQLRLRNRTPSHGLIRLLIILFPSDGGHGTGDEMVQRLPGKIRLMGAPEG